MSAIGECCVCLEDKNLVGFPHQTDEKLDVLHRLCEGCLKGLKSLACPLCQGAARANVLNKQITAVPVPQAPKAPQAAIQAPVQALVQAPVINAAPVRLAAAAVLPVIAPPVVEVFMDLTPDIKDQNAVLMDLAPDFFVDAEGDFII